MPMARSLHRHAPRVGAAMTGDGLADRVGGRAVIVSGRLLTDGDIRLRVSRRMCAMPSPSATTLEEILRLLGERIRRLREARGWARKPSPNAATSTSRTLGESSAGKRT